MYAQLPPNCSGATASIDRPSRVQIFEYSSIAQCSCKYLHKFPFVCLSFSIINFFWELYSMVVRLVRKCPQWMKCLLLKVQFVCGCSVTGLNTDDLLNTVYIYKSPRGRGLGLQALGTQKSKEDFKRYMSFDICKKFLRYTVGIFFL